MKHAKRLFHFLSGSLFAIFLAATAQAAQPIPKDKLAAMLTGKTADGMHHRKGFAYKIYFAPDGKLLRVKENGDQSGGEWKIKDNGRHCVQFDHMYAFKCFYFRDGGDGSITKFKVKDNGDTILLTTLKNFKDGNHTGAK